MQSERLVGPEGIEVPNAFSIALHPDDLAELAPYQASLETRIARYLSGFADERGLVPVGAVSVTLVADPGLRRRALRVDARMADPAHRAGDAAGRAARIDRRAAESPPRAAAESPRSIPWCWSSKTAASLRCRTDRCGSGGPSTTTW